MVYDTNGNQTSHIYLKDIFRNICESSRVRIESVTKENRLYSIIASVTDSEGNTSIIDIEAACGGINAEVTAIISKEDGSALVCMRKNGEVFNYENSDAGTCAFEALIPVKIEEDRIILAGVVSTACESDPEGKEESIIVVFDRAD